MFTQQSFEAMANQIGQMLGQFAPKALAAIAFLFIGYLVAKVVSVGARFALHKTGLGKKMDRWFVAEGGSGSRGAERAVARGIFYLIMLFVLVGFFQTLGLSMVTEPLNQFLGQIFYYAPQVLGAAAILIVGWFSAKIIRFVVHQGLITTRLDRYMEERAGMRGSKMRPVSSLLADASYWLVILFFLPAALGTLNIPVISGPLSNMLNSILSALPLIFMAVLVVGLAYILGRVVSGLVTSVLGSVGFDHLPVVLGLAKQEKIRGRSASEVAGTLTLAAILFLAITQALPLLGLTVLSELFAEFFVFAGQVMLGLTIVALGLYLAKLVADAIRATGIENAALFATVSRIAILVFAFAIGLRRMGLANEIVNMAFGLTLGALAVAVALAFGLGGRDAARSFLSDVGKKRKGNVSVIHGSAKKQPKRPAAHH